MAYKDVIQSPGRIITKRIYCQSGNTYITLSNDVFYSAKIGTNYNLGDGTVCTYLELELDRELDLSHDGDYILMNIYAHVQGGQEYGYGFNRFYPKELTNNYDVNSKHYIYKLYDGMIKAMIPYIPVNITYPTTCQTYFNALINALGWTGNITLDVTGSKVFEEDIYDGMNFTYRDIISDILQANGIVGYMSGNTTIASKVLNTSSTPTDVINDDILKNVNVQLGKKFGPINSLTLSRSNDTDLITAKDDTSITNNGLTNIVIKDNYLLNDDDRSDYINALFNKYKGKQWYLYDCELTGYGGLNILSPITISTNGENYNSLIFNYEINLDEGYSEVIYNDIEEGYSNTKYMYTDSEVKADKNAEIIIDKKIGEVDIRGKAINLTADDITIQSTNFNVDKNGNIQCNDAVMRNATAINLVVDSGQAHFDGIGDEPIVTVNDAISGFNTNLWGSSIVMDNGNGKDFFEVNYGGIKFKDRYILDNEVLWNGVYYMNASQTANLSEKISDQPHGIVLVWSKYASGQANDSSWQFHFVPKSFVDFYGSGNGCSFMLGGTRFSNMATKYLYISDGSIKGHADNTASGTASGITYNNSAYVLRYVIGV